MSKADTMLAILWLLRTHDRMTAQQLAEELEVHVRTIYRCIDSLCASGVPIAADPGHHGGYHILGDFRDAPLSFDHEECKALMQAADFARDAGYPFAGALDRAARKLKRYANAEQSEHIARHMGNFSVVQPPIDERQSSVLRTLESAAADGCTLTIRYRKDRGIEAEPRDIDPYGLVFWKGSWYVVGYCRLRRGLRSFRVDRIERLEPSGDRFERPSGFSARDFLLQGLLSGQTDAEAYCSVIIRGPEQALNDLCRHWLFGHALEERSPGEIRLRLKAESLGTFVPYFLLPYGCALTIVEPPELIRRMAEVAGRLSDHYHSMLTVRSEE